MSGLFRSEVRRHRRAPDLEGHSCGVVSVALAGRAFPLATLPLGGRYQPPRIHVWALQKSPPSTQPSSLSVPEFCKVIFPE